MAATAEVSTVFPEQSEFLEPLIVITLVDPLTKWLCLILSSTEFAPSRRKNGNPIDRRGDGIFSTRLTIF